MDAATRALEVVTEKASAASTKFTAAQALIKDYEGQVASIDKSITTTGIELNVAESKLGSLRKRFSILTLDLSALQSNYRSATSAATTAAANSRRLSAVASASKKAADAALAAYRAASGKNLISTEKPFTVDNSIVGETSLNRATNDVKELKEISDRAAAKYEKDKKAASDAQSIANQKVALANKVKALLDEKISQGAALESEIATKEKNIEGLRAQLRDLESNKEQALENLSSAKAASISEQNRLTAALVAAQKARVRVTQLEADFDASKKDAANADKVNNAKEQAEKDADQAEKDVEGAESGVDEITTVSTVTSSLRSLPLILTIVGVVAAVAFLALNAVKRSRRKGGEGEIDIDEFVGGEEVARFAPPVAKKAVAKKSPAKKSPAKQSPAKKSPAKKAVAKKAAAKKKPAKK